ncbi:MAG: ABC transporter permease subunit [Bacilli bacterium]|nr:ABC transporter permease subunit [Bacilli bacterium]
MTRLLNAGFMRMRKSKVFKVLTIFSIGLALLIVLVQYNEMVKYDKVIDVSNLAFLYATLISIVSSIFISLFLGVEYSDGTIRNKISIGHSRINIYLSNLILTILATLYSYILYLFVIIVIGLPLFSVFTMSIQAFILKLAIIILIIICECCIYTFIAMIISNKTMIAVANIMTSFGLMMFALYCYSLLNTPQYIDVAKITNQETYDYEIVKELNPKYPTEEKRKIYQTLLDINPSGQTFQLVGGESKNIKLYPLYATGVSIIFICTGLILFRKKELK